MLKTRRNIFILLQLVRFLLIVNQTIDSVPASVYLHTDAMHIRYSTSAYTLPPLPFSSYPISTSCPSHAARMWAQNGLPDFSHINCKARSALDSGLI